MAVFQANLEPKMGQQYLWSMLTVFKCEMML